MENTKRKVGYPEKIGRNGEIYKKKQEGVSYNQLSWEYRLSITTIQKIVKRWKKREEIKN